MLMTIFAILSVDFPVFPRFLAKCETFSRMSLIQLEAHFEADSPQVDLGVGSFGFFQGIVPLTKDPSYLTSSLPSKLFKVTRKSILVMVLGLVRCADIDDEDAQCDAGRLDTARLRGQRTAMFREQRTWWRKQLTRKMSVDERQANQRKTDQETV